MPRVIKIELDGSRYGRSSNHLGMQLEAEKEITELLREDVKLMFECEFSAERAMEALRMMGNDEFSWPTDQEDRLRSVKRCMIRGEFEFGDAEPVVNDAVARLAAMSGLEAWRPKALENQAFDVIDSALSALAAGVDDPAGEVLNVLTARAWKSATWPIERSRDNGRQEWNRMD